ADAVDALGVDDARRRVHPPPHTHLSFPQPRIIRCKADVLRDMFYPAHWVLIERADVARRVPDEDAITLRSGGLTGAENLAVQDDGQVRILVPHEGDVAVDGVGHGDLRVSGRKGGSRGYVGGRSRVYGDPRWS